MCSSLKIRTSSLKIINIFQIFNRNVDFPVWENLKRQTQSAQHKPYDSLELELNCSEEFGITDKGLM